jgi:hypothetical protein
MSGMLRPIAILLAMLSLIGCDATKPAPVPAPPVAEEGPPYFRILFVGNSHTSMHDLPALVGYMIRHRQPKKSVYTQILSVSFLEDLADNPVAREQLESKPWTHVVLQAQKISMSGRFEYSRTEGIEFAKLAKGRGATVNFYPEWGLAGAAGDGSKQEAVYREMARDAGVGVAPVAKAWDHALVGRPEMKLHSDDGNHQSRLGAFLTACVLFAQITGESPAEPSVYPDQEVGEKDREYLAGVAARAMADEKRTAPFPQK